MGAWGCKVFENDTACDLTDTISKNLFKIVNKKKN